MDQPPAPASATSATPKMTDKMKACFTPHIMMHSLFGLGLGLLLAPWLMGWPLMWIGAGLMIIAVILDMMRKS